MLRALGLVSRGHDGGGLQSGAALPAVGDRHAGALIAADACRLVQRWLLLGDRLRRAKLSAGSPCAKQSTAPEDAMFDCRSLRRIQSAGSLAQTCWRWRPLFILLDTCHRYMKALLHLRLFFRWVPAVLPALSLVACILDYGAALSAQHFTELPVLLASSLTVYVTLSVGTALGMR